MRNLDSNSQEGQSDAHEGLTFYPNGQSVSGPIVIHKPTKDGLFGSLARNGNITNKEFNVHYTNDVREMEELHKKNSRPISVFPTAIFSGVSLEDNNSLMAVELSKSTSISREEIEQALNGQTAICFHGDHTKASEILRTTAVSQENLAELSRGKTILALCPNISTKEEFIGLESIGKVN